AVAWYDYQSALKLNRTLNQSEKRRRELEDFARGALRQLEPRVPRLRIRLETRPEGTTVTRDGIILPDGAIGEELLGDPVEHEIRVEAPGFVGRVERVTLREAESREVELLLTKAPPASAPENPPALPTSRVDTNGVVRAATDERATSAWN